MPHCAFAKRAKRLDANFIEGMACIGGCIGGAGCLTHGEKNKAEVDKYGREAYEKPFRTRCRCLNTDERKRKLRDRTN
ncbi:MAG: [Fe-Fe] hydrogenase large subunit C-terminal domain-containing protein [Christensenellales bacterium]